MIYPVVVYGDPVLKAKGKKVDFEELDVKALTEDMFETMYNANGVGLAAPQIGKSLRLFVVDAEGMDEENLKGFKKVFVNPTILEETGEDWGFEEGCLSIPTIRGEVKRKEKIKVHYFDEEGNEKEEEFDGLAARVIQHEYDHIDGVLFIEKLPPLKRSLLRGKLNNISKGKINAGYRTKVYVPKKTRR